MRPARLGGALALACAGAAWGSGALQAEPRPLNDVVDDLLERECIRLRAADPPGVDPASIFEGPLRTLCERGRGSGAPVSAASGGGAAAPGPASRLIQQLLRGSDLAGGDGPAFLLNDRLSVFVLGGWGAVDRKQTDFEDAYDSNLQQAVIGASYDVLPGLAAGLVLDYVHEDGSYDSGGDFDTDQYGIAFYTRLQPYEPVMLGVSAGYAWQRHQRSRLAVFEESFPDDPGNDFVRRGLVDADHDADVFSLALSVAGNWSFGPATVTPLAGLAWRRTEYDAYSETGDTGMELSFDEDDETSLLSSLGLGLGTVWSLGTVDLLPQLEFSWLHEFEDDQRSIEMSFVDDPRNVPFKFGTEPPDRNFYRLAASLSAGLPNGLQPFIQAETILGNSRYDSYSAVLGLSFRL